MLLPSFNSGINVREIRNINMILTGSVLLLLGVIGVVTSFVNRTTTGWASTRLKFVVTSWGLLAGGAIVTIAGAGQAQLIFRYFIPN
jgi:hypothetical protein